MVCIRRRCAEVPGPKRTELPAHTPDGAVRVERDSGDGAIGEHVVGRVDPIAGERACRRQRQGEQQGGKCNLLGELIQWCCSTCLRSKYPDLLAERSRNYVGALGCREEGRGG